MINSFYLCKAPNKLYALSTLYISRYHNFTSFHPKHELFYVTHVIIISSVKQYKGSYDKKDLFLFKAVQHQVLPNHPQLPVKS